MFIMRAPLTGFVNWVVWVRSLVSRCTEMVKPHPQSSPFLSFYLDVAVAIPPLSASAPRPLPRRFNCPFMPFLFRRFLSFSGRVLGPPPLQPPSVLSFFFLLSALFLPNAPAVPRRVVFSRSSERGLGADSYKPASGLKRFCPFRFSLRVRMNRSIFLLFCFLLSHLGLPRSVGLLSSALVKLAPALSRAAKWRQSPA